MRDGLKVIFFKDCGIWSAQCVEYDIGAQADDLDTAKLRFQIALEMELEESIRLRGEAFAGIDPAPERFQLLWDKRAHAFQSEASVSLRSEKRVHLDMAIAA